MPTGVTLHIYDATGHEVITGMNKALKVLGTGAFHGAVEVYGREWSFGYVEGDTGVFCCEPGKCEAHSYKEAVDMGQTQMSEDEVSALIERMASDWPGESYELLTKNCCSFCDAFCIELGVGPIPKWVSNLAGAGATVQDGLFKAASKVEATRIIAAAKAGEIDEKYQVRSKFQAAAGAAAAKAGEIDEKYQVRQRVEAAGAAAAAKAGEIDEQYKVREKVEATREKLVSKTKELDAQYGISDAVSAAAKAATLKAGALFSKFEAPAAGKNDIAAPPPNAELPAVEK